MDVVIEQDVLAAAVLRRNAGHHLFKLNDIWVYVVTKTEPFPAGVMKGLMRKSTMGRDSVDKL